MVRVWSSKENMLLARAYIDVTEDPIHINDNARNFWGRVAETYLRQAHVQPMFLEVKINSSLNGDMQMQLILTMCFIG